MSCCVPAHALAQFPAPDRIGAVYVLAYFPGCSACELPASFELYRGANELELEFGVQLDDTHLTELEWSEVNEDVEFSSLNHPQLEQLLTRTTEARAGSRERARPNPGVEPCEVQLPGDSSASPGHHREDL